MSDHVCVRPCLCFCLTHLPPRGKTQYQQQYIYIYIYIYWKDYYFEELVVKLTLNLTVYFPQGRKQQFKVLVGFSGVSRPFSAVG